VYAAPLFIRLLGEVETTGTFKYKKADLKQAAYNPAAVQEPLWVRLPGEQCFTELDPSLFAAIGQEAYRF
jgi:citronellyl-CoA synthetase